jgi:hypothetical protein
MFNNQPHRTMLYAKTYVILLKIDKPVADMFFMNLNRYCLLVTIIKTRKKY